MVGEVNGELGETGGVEDRQGVVAQVCGEIAEIARGVQECR